MDFILAPDVFVNASVAPGTPPDGVVQRVLGKKQAQAKVSTWVLDRVQAMLTSLPDFKADAVADQMSLIRSLVNEIEIDGAFGAADWASALKATARSAGAGRVVTDHPDLLDVGDSDGIEFISTDVILLEMTTPPPTPGS